MRNCVARYGIGILTALTALGLGQLSSLAQTGSFVAVLNNSTGNGDSRQSVEYFDASDLASGPLFSVFVGYERDTNTEDPNAIDVDPLTGDVYVTAFDSGTPPTLDTGPAQDTSGDMDLYKIPFATVYNTWVSTYKGKNVRAPLIVGGPAPTGTKNSLNQDYVTFGVTGPGGFDFDVSHSNTVVLAGSVQKIAEVKRNHNPDTSNFFPPALTFIDQNTLLLVDDSSATTATNTPETDHEYRILERVSTSPGAANGAVLDHLDGGFNGGTTQSWNSTRIAKVALDSTTGHSEPESAAFYSDPLSGVRGVWVTESDGGGDDIAFLQLDEDNDSLGYRLFSTGAPSFALDNDPAVSTASNDGAADNIMVDRDTGDVLIIESGAFDTPTSEPSVLRLHPTSYDSAGAIDIGNSSNWSAKVTLNPTKTPGDAVLERGQWSAWDSANDRMYFFNPGAAGETPAFEVDLTYIDLKVGSPTFGQTISHLDLDDSVSLFLGDAFGDKVVAFTLAAAEDADFDNDQDIDGADFLAWQRGFGGTSPGDANGDGQVNATDFTIWQRQFGEMIPAGGAVPEPSSVALAVLGMLAGMGLRRRG